MGIFLCYSTQTFSKINATKTFPVSREHCQEVSYNVIEVHYYSFKVDTSTFESIVFLITGHYAEACSNVIFIKEEVSKAYVNSIYIPSKRMQARKSLFYF